MQTIYEVVVKGIPTSIKSVGELNAAMKKVNEEFKSSDFGSPKFKQLQKDLGVLKGVQQDITKTTREYAKSQGVAANSAEGLRQQAKGLKTALSLVDPKTEDFKKYEKQLAEVTLEQKKLRDSSKAVKRDLELSTVDPTSLRGLELTYAKLRAEIKLMPQEAREAAEGLQKINEAAAARGQITELNKQLNDFGANVGNYPELLQNAAGSFGGFFELFKGQDESFAFQNLGENLGGAVGKGLGIGLAVGGAAALTSYVAGVVNEFEELNKKVSSTLGVTGDELDTFTARAKSIADVFGKDFDEVLTSVNNFAKQTEISLEEAFDLTEKGFIAGADSSGNFLSNLAEFPTQFDNSGKSAEDFIKLATQEVRGGFLDSKLLDTIKEVDLSLKEVSQTQKDALDLLGTDFSEQLQKDLAQGVITTDQAFTKIVDQAEKAGLNIQETQVLVADLFKGAGEDAGGFQKVVEAVFTASSRSLQDYIEDTSALNQAQARQLEIQNDLNEAQQRLFNIFGEGNVELDNFTTILETELVTALVEILEVFDQQIDMITDVLDAFGLLDNEFTETISGAKLLAIAVKSAIIGPLEVAAKSTKLLRSFFFELGGVIVKVNRDISNLDFSNLTNSFDGFLKRVGVGAGLIDEAETSTTRWSDALNRLSNETKEQAQAAIDADEANKKQVTSYQQLKERAEKLSETVKNLATQGKDYTEEQKELEAVLNRIKEIDNLTKFDDDSKASKEAADNLKALNKELDNTIKLSENLGLDNNSLDFFKKAAEESKKLEEILNNPIQPEGNAAPTDGSEFEDVVIKNRIEKQKEFLESSKLNQLESEKEILNEKLLNSNLEFNEKLRLADALAAKELEIVRETERLKAEERKKSYESLGEVLSGVSEGISSLQDIGDIRYNNQLNKLESNYERELELAGENESERIAAEERFEAAKRKLDKEAFDRNKKFAIAQALVNGALAATQALANTTLPFPISLTALIPVAIQTGLQVATIRSQEFKGEKGFYFTQEEAASMAPQYMEKGGTVTIGGFAKGRRHSQGGIKTSFFGVPAEIEDGEFVDVMEDGGIAVINRNSSNQFKDAFKAMAGKQFEGKKSLYSKMNQIGGGIAFGRDGLSIGAVSNFSSLGRESFKNRGVELNVRVNNKVEMSEEIMDNFADKVADKNAAGSFQGTKEALTENSINNNNDNLTRNA